MQPTMRLIDYLLTDVIGFLTDPSVASQRLSKAASSNVAITHEKLIKKARKKLRNIEFMSIVLEVGEAEIDIPSTFIENKSYSTKNFKQLKISLPRLKVENFMMKRKDRLKKKPFCDEIFQQSQGLPNAEKFENLFIYDEVYVINMSRLRISAGDGGAPKSFEEVASDLDMKLEVGLPMLFEEFETVYSCIGSSMI